MTAESLGMASRPISKLFGSLRASVRDHGITLTQLSALTVIEPEQIMMSEIATALGLSTAAATGLVDRLEEAKLVERKHAAGDRRCVFVSLTDKGRQLLVDLAKDLKGEGALSYAL